MLTTIAFHVCLLTLNAKMHIHPKVIKEHFITLSLRSQNLSECFVSTKPGSIEY